MPTPVKIYTLSTCGHCKAAKKLLAECSVDFNFLDVDLLSGEERTNAVEEVKKLNPEISFPTIIIGNKVIIGFKEKEIREALGL